MCALAKQSPLLLRSATREYYARRTGRLSGEIRIIKCTGARWEGQETDGVAYREGKSDTPAACQNSLDCTREPARFACLSAAFFQGFALARTFASQDECFCSASNFDTLPAFISLRIATGRVAQFMSDRKVQQAFSTKMPNVNKLGKAFRCSPH